MAMSESTFNGYLAKILSARYGEEVRGSIHDSLQGMYEIVKGNTLDVTTAKQTIDTAAAAANSAASKANTAASNADAATSKANASATKADTAAAGADTAKNAANTAATNATTEAGKATTAATQANAAKEAANTAASSANSAASAATEAAGKVDAAIAQANTAAAGANSAKTEADKAANRANDAAAIIETLDVGDINTGEIATKRYVTERIDAIQIGGMNLFTGTRDFSGAWRNKSQWKYEGKYRNLDVYSKSTNWNGLYQYVKASSVSEQFTFSFYARSDTSATISVYRQPYASVIFTASVTNEWERFSGTFTPGKLNSDGTFYLSPDITDNKKVYVCGFKLEYGNKATDWSPAPEDISISNVRNLLKNSNKPFTKFNISNITFETGITVKEWCTDNAIHVYGSDGTARTVGFYDVRVPQTFYQVGVNYTGSVYIKNNSESNKFVVELNGGHGNVTINPGESKKVVIKTVGDGVTNKYVQLTFITEQVGEAFDITYYGPMLYLGNSYAEYIPSVEDIQPSIFDSSGNVQLSDDNLQKLAKSLKTYLNN